MKNDTWIGKKGLRYWYYHFRDSEYFSLSIIGLTVVACLFLVFNVIIPQLNNWFSIREETIATRDRIAVLQHNIDFMNNIDKNAMNTQLQTATDALPIEKDFGAMLDALSQAALSSGVALNDYSFQVGNVSPSADTSADVRYKGISSMRITLIINGQVESIRRFINSVESTVPISEVVNVDGNDQTVSISIQFYEKSFPDIKVDVDKPITPITANKLALLQKLSAWKKATSQGVPSGSSSAMPLF